MAMLKVLFSFGRFLWGRGLTALFGFLGFQWIGFGLSRIWMFSMVRIRFFVGLDFI